MTACWLGCFLCFPSLLRVFPEAPGELGEVYARRVQARVREALHAEHGLIPGPVHRAEALLHRRQRQPGGDAERLLVAAAGAFVPAVQLAVPLQRLLPGVRQQAHGGAETLRRHSQDTECPGQQGLHRRADLCPGADGRTGGRQQGRQSKSGCLSAAAGAVIRKSMNAHGGRFHLMVLIYEED